MCLLFQNKIVYLLGENEKSYQFESLTFYLLLFSKSCQCFKVAACFIGGRGCTRKTLSF